jgi:hypothetical protein
MLTETVAADTTAPTVKLGTAADDDAYANLVINAGAADNDCWDETDDTDAIISANIDADTLLKVTLTHAVDATAAAGAGVPFFVFEIWQ